MRSFAAVALSEIPDPCTAFKVDIGCAVVGPKSIALHTMNQTRTATVCWLNK